MGIFFLLLISFLPFNYVQAQGFGFSDPRQVDFETIKLLEKIQDDLKKSPATLELNCKSNSAVTCDFMLMCDKLRANRNSKALYKNGKGEVIPNYKLLYLQETVDQCRNNVSASESKKANPFTEMQKNSSKKRKDFLNSIQAHKEEAKMTKIEQAMLDMSLENATDINPWFIPKEQIEKNIADAEARAGVKLSDESRKKWIEALDQASFLSNQSDSKIKTSSNENPFIKTTLLTNIKEAGSKKKVLEYQAQFQKELDRSFDIFSDTKSQIIAILNKRMDGKNNAEINNLIARIKTIKMNAPELSGVAANIGACSHPNAFYDPTSHTFTLCPQLLQMPSATIQAIIAHELGHSIDPCTATYPLEKIEGTEKPNPYLAYMGDEKTQKTMSEQMGLVDFKPNLPNQGQDKFSAFDVDYIHNSLSQAYDNFSLKEQQQSVNLSKNPFLPVVNCMQTYESVGARIGDVYGAKGAITKKLSDLKKSGATDSDPRVEELKQTLGRIDSVYAEKKACSFMGSYEGHSQIQEAFSDWIASEVIGNKIANTSDPQEKQQIAFEANGFFAALDCRSFDLDIRESAKNALEKAGCISRGSMLTKDIGNMQLYDDPHPEGYKRINKIFMANPTTANALSCQKDSGVKYCE